MKSFKKGKNSQRPAGKRKPPIVSYGEVSEIRAVERVPGMFYEKEFWVYVEADQEMR